MFLIRSKMHISIWDPVAATTDRNSRNTYESKLASLDKSLLDKLLTRLLLVGSFCVISMRIEDECQ